MSVNQSASDEPSRSTPQPSSEADPSPHVEELLEEEERGGVVSDGQRLPEQGGNWWQKLKLMLLGKPRDLADQSLFHSVSLVAFLAWVGLGADGLSSSCYGPSEAFAHLREHSYLAFVSGHGHRGHGLHYRFVLQPHRRRVSQRRRRISGRLEAAGQACRRDLRMCPPGRLRPDDHRLDRSRRRRRLQPAGRKLGSVEIALRVRRRSSL